MEQGDELLEVDGVSLQDRTPFQVRGNFTNISITGLLQRTQAWIAEI